MLRPLLAALAGAAILYALAAPPAGGPAPPLCRVQASSAPSRLPGFYDVTIELRPECRADAVADVRLESYVGGTWPRKGWFRVTKARPLKRGGIPWYWRAAWRSASGQPYPLVIPGLGGSL
ncbi:hypothetical protein [Deinococcus sp. S9]|uniref:hypothetical protein n=1 Tax=Deinococcus sp. S9 TaxID=2545754 RepID=UPI0010542144|nr:hypothetical protein [Deinococcus sp. S9]TDE86000.1 hypothetical protein E0686_09165 [Deinococcus sp. S9]